MNRDSTSGTAITDGTPPPIGTVDGLWQVLAFVELPVAIAAADTTILWCSDAFADLASSQPDLLVGRPFAEALGTERAERVTNVLCDVAESGRTLGRALIGATDWAGTVRRLAVSAATTRLVGDEPLLFIAVENKTNDRRTLYANDVSLGGATAAGPLAALPPRPTFEALFDAALRRAQRGGVPVGVLVCSIDDLAEISRRIGHDGVETLVAATAARLVHALRGEDLIMHDGGGRFIIAADSVPNDEVALQIARRLRSAVGEPIIIGDVEVRAGMSIGFALGFERGPELIVQAERALAYASSRGGNRTVSTTEADAAVSPDAAEIDWNELARNVSG